MPSIKEISERVTMVRTQLPDQVDQIISDNEDEILDLNKEDQLYMGKDVYGNDLPTYKPLTEQLSKGFSGKGYPKNAGEPFNMYATGGLFRSIDLFVNNGNVKIFTRDKNHPFITQRRELSEKIFGLTKENQGKVNFDILLPQLRTWVKRSI